MKLEKTIILAISLMVTSSTYAQYTSDALRFSQFENAVDARFGAMGGTKSAVGGNISSIYGSPGGLGMFSKSEFSLTPELNLKNNSLTAYGANSDATKNYMDLSNVGVVFHSRTYKSGDTKKGLLSLNLGIGYQKRATYKNEFNFGGNENNNGLGNFFAQESNADQGTGAQNDALNLSSDVNYAAYYGFLTTLTPSGNPAYTRLPDANASQTNQVMRSGGSSEVDFSIGTNFSNKVFIGVGLGLASFNYSSIEETRETGTYTDPVNNSNNNPYSAIYRRNFDTDGSGVNLKLGMILKPTSELSVGLNLESPTWFNVSDNYSESLNAQNENYSQSESYPFEYNLQTPLKLNGGLAYFIGDKGFISADVGFADYSSVKFTTNSSGSLENSTNMEIKRLYKNTVNYSLGGEFKVNESFLLRAGFRSTGNPYQNLDDKDYTIKSISGGLGYRFGDYYLDAALINSNSNLSYSNYTLNNGNQPFASIETRTNRISLTFGVRF